jgi:NAD(P)-dependent dehydrogenase (short-subunit alcohol dehydrogenase family)
VDILVNNAGEDIIHFRRLVNTAVTDEDPSGIVRDASFARMTKQQWDDVYRVHLEGTMRSVKDPFG